MQNKETQPQAKNKPDPRFDGPYCSAPGFRLACPLESAPISPMPPLMGKRQIGIFFFTSFFPPFPSPNSFSAS